MIVNGLWDLRGACSANLSPRALHDPPTFIES